MPNPWELTYDTGEEIPPWEQEWQAESSDQNPGLYTDAERDTILNGPAIDASIPDKVLNLRNPGVAPAPSFDPYRMAVASQDVPMPGHQTQMGAELQRSAEAFGTTPANDLAIKSGQFLNQKALQPQPGEEAPALAGLTTHGMGLSRRYASEAEPPPPGVYRETLKGAAEDMSWTPEMVHGARRGVAAAFSDPNDPESAAWVDAAYQGAPETIDKIIAGADKAVVGSAVSMFEPENLPFLATMLPVIGPALVETVGVAGMKAITAAFMADMAGKAPELYDEVATALKSDDSEKKAEVLGNAAIAHLFFAFMGAHLTDPGFHLPDTIVQRIKQGNRVIEPTLPEQRIVQPSPLRQALEAKEREGWNNRIAELENDPDVTGKQIVRYDENGAVYESTGKPVDEQKVQELNDLKERRDKANASSQQQAAEVHGDMRSSTGEGSGEVSTTQSGGGVQSRTGTAPGNEPPAQSTETKSGEVSLNDPNNVASPAEKDYVEDVIRKVAGDTGQGGDYHITNDAEQAQGLAPGEKPNTSAAWYDTGTKKIMINWDRLHAQLDRLPADRQAAHIESLIAHESTHHLGDRVTTEPERLGVWNGAGKIIQSLFKKFYGESGKDFTETQWAHEYLRHLREVAMGRKDRVELTGRTGTSLWTAKGIDLVLRSIDAIRKKLPTEGGRAIRAVLSKMEGNLKAARPAVAAREKLKAPEQKRPITEEDNRLLKGYFTTGKNLSELTGGKPVFHETSLDNAYSIFRRMTKFNGTGWNQFYVSKNIDTAIGQGSKGIKFEFDPERINGSPNNNPSKVGSGELILDKAVHGAINAVLFKNERQVEAFKKRFPKGLQYDNAQKVDGGVLSGEMIRVPRYNEAAKPERLSAPETPPTPDEIKEDVIRARMKAGIKPEDVQVVINKDPSFPKADYVQIDEIKPVEGGSHFSSNPEQLRSLGMNIPTRADLMKLPAGRYTLAEVREKLAPPAGSKGEASFYGYQYGDPIFTIQTGKYPSHVRAEHAKSLGYSIPEKIPTLRQWNSGERLSAPFHETAKKVVRDLDNRRKAFGTLWRGRPNAKNMAQDFDAAQNRAVNLGEQVRKGLEIDKPKADQEAASAIIVSGFDRNELTSLRGRVAGGMNGPKKATALKAIDRAISDFGRLSDLARRGVADFDAELQVEQAGGLDVERHEDYLPGVYDKDLWMGNRRPYVIGGGGGGGGSGFKRGKTFANPFEAVAAGYAPKSLALSELAEHRVRTGQQLLNKRAWAEALKQAVDPTDGRAVATDLIRKPKPGGGWDEVAPPGYQTVHLPGGTRLAIHEVYAPAFKALTGESIVASHPVGKTILDIVGGIKHGLLFFDTFHASRIMQKQLFLEGRVGWKKGQSLLEYRDSDLARAQAAGEITPEMVNWIRQNRPYHELALRNGLNVGRIAEAMYTDVVRSLPVFGAFNKWVFEKVSRGAMMESFIREMKRMEQTRPELSQADIARRVARDLNVYYGNLGRQGFFKSQTMQDMARIVSLAPQWFEAMGRNEARGFGQLGKASVTGKAGTLGKGMGQGLLAYFVGTQLLNLVTRGQPTWKNEEEGHKMDAWIPPMNGKGNGFFLSPFSVVAELTHDLKRYAEKEGSVLPAAVKILSNKTSSLVRAGSILATGKGYYGDVATEGAWDRAKKAAFALNPLPIAVQPVFKTTYPGQLQRQLTGSLGVKTEPAETAVQQMFTKARRFMESEGTPMEPSTQTEGPSYSKLRAALRTEDYKEANKIFDKLAETRPEGKIFDAMEHNVLHPFTGSKKQEDRFKTSLSDKELELYDRAVDQRQDEFEKFQDHVWSQ